MAPLFRKPKGAKQCAFCWETANLTQEHLWSAWIGKALGAPSYKFTHKNPDGTVRMWRGSELNSKAKVVCEKCNNGWMSDLENSSIPILKNMILHGSDTILSARDIATIAAVTFKNSVVADHIQNYRLPYFSFKERRLFSDTLTIPFGVQMWLASKVGHDAIFKSYYACTATGTPNGFEILVFTYGVGHLLIQCTSARPTKKILRRHAQERPLTADKEWDPIALPFWPNPAIPLKWPHLSHLGDQAIESFVHRWENLVRPV